jgi:hypothetical protein
MLEAGKSAKEKEEDRGQPSEYKSRMPRLPILQLHSHSNCVRYNHPRDPRAASKAITVNSQADCNPRLAEMRSKKG